MIKMATAAHAPDVCARTPLKGIRVLELAGAGLGPLAGMILADYGCDVVRVDPPSVVTDHTMAGRYVDSLCRRKRSVVIDLKCEASRSAFLDLVDMSDVLIETYRPGTLDRLGLGAESLCRRNPRLVYARLTGFPRAGGGGGGGGGRRCHGPAAYQVGHELNYLAASGTLPALAHLRHDETLRKPSANYLGDFGGGTMSCVIGILLALLHRSTTGEGQIIDASVADGVSYLGTFPRQRAKGQPPHEPALDITAAPYYEIYPTKDGKYMSVASLEPWYYDAFLRGLGLKPATLPDRNNRANWSALRAIFTERFASQTQTYWRSKFDTIEACVTPVLDVDDDYDNDDDDNHDDASGDTHLRQRQRQRPLVQLNKSPSLPIEKEESFPSLRPGDGCEEVLRSWLGWRRGSISIDSRTRTLSRRTVVGRESKL